MTEPQEVHVTADLTKKSYFTKTDKPSYYFVLANNVFGGGLDDYLRQCRAEGKTYEWIHHDLWNRDIPLSLPTVVRWCNMYI